MNRYEIADARWSEDGASASLFDSSGGFARLQVEHWYDDGEREPVIAWVVSWPTPNNEFPHMHHRLVEAPALVADDDERRHHLVSAALAMIDKPSPEPSPFAIPPPTPRSADEWAEHLDLQISCWEDAFGDLQAAVNSREEYALYKRYRALSEALERIYAVDSSLNLLWRQLNVDTREELSRRTDDQAHRAAEHNSRSTMPFDVSTDAMFVGYVRRIEDGQPYATWSDLMLAGVFQSRFFQAVGWARGQIVHAATSLPIDMRQWRPGIEPRWKWRESELWGRGRPDEASRRAYDELLATHDVIGLLGHLTEVFADGRRALTQALRAEQGPRG